MALYLKLQFYNFFIYSKVCH